jgi:hypothetical protein
MSITEDTIAIARLEERMKHMEGTINTMSGQLDEVVKALGEARGGWKTLMLVGGAAAAAASAVTWLANFLHLRGSP